MPEPKQREVDTPPASSEGEDQPGAGDGTPQPTDAEEKKKLAEELAKEQKARHDFELAFYKAKEDYRELKMRNSNPPADFSLQDDDPDLYTKKIVREELGKKATEDKEKALKIAFDKFSESHPEYKPENDVNDYNYNRLHQKTEKMVLGETTEEILESLEFVHRGITNKPKSPDSNKVEDSGIGDVVLKPKSSEKLPDAMTRPLTELQKKAAALHPGGEKGYREALAKLEQKAF